MLSAELDEDFYIAPPTKIYEVAAYGENSTFQTLTTEPGKIWSAERCKEEETYAVSFRYYTPLAQSHGPTSLLSMDLETLDANMSKGDASNGVFALITMPDRQCLFSQALLEMV